MFKEQKFETRDLYEASALYASGIRNVTTRFTGDKERRICWFEFSPTAEARKASKQYWDKTLHVSALTYAESIRSLRDMLYSQKED